MSLKSGLIKAAIKMTPDCMVIWVANIVLKGIAKLTKFHFDLETRKAYLQTLLAGEEQPIEIWLEDFAVYHEEDGYKFILRKADSNKQWMHGVFAHIAGKAWKIPAIPQLAPHLDLVVELLADKNSE
jgi:hypothetical protein